MFSNFFSSQNGLECNNIYNAIKTFCKLPVKDLTDCDVALHISTVVFFHVYLRNCVQLSCVLGLESDITAFTTDTYCLSKCYKTCSNKCENPFV